MNLSATEYQTRREKIFAQMADNSIAIIASAIHHHRNFDNEMVFRQSSDFYYVTGFPEPRAMAVLLKTNGQNKFILFSQKRDPNMETWTGPIVGQERACSLYGADEAFDINTFETQLPDLLRDRSIVYYEFGCHPQVETLISKTVHALQARVRYMEETPRTFQNIHGLLHPLRFIKSDAELAIMEKVANISAHAHIACMKATKPGMYEYQIKATFIYESMMAGCLHEAYPGIFAGGKNACTLHYTANTDQLNDGELLLIDAGAELDCYASDITRTFPINGKFSAPQQALYELVLHTQKEAINLVAPGSSRERLEAATAKHFSQGLIDLGFFKESLDTVLTEKLYRQFYPHRIGHWLGVDTHDRGDYIKDGDSIPYEPGVVLTVEPGLYIPPNTKGVDDKWLGIGIRIEDDVAVTKQGNKVLTSAVTKEIAEIEALMA